MASIWMGVVETVVLMISIFEVVDRCQTWLESGRWKTNSDRIDPWRWIKRRSRLCLLPEYDEEVRE